MNDQARIETKLSEIRQRHTGKAPFGPLDDLDDMFESENNEGRKVLIKLLETRRDDPFWGYFAKVFLEKRL